MLIHLLHTAIYDDITLLLQPKWASWPDDCQQVLTHSQEYVEVLADLQNTGSTRFCIRTVIKCQRKQCNETVAGMNE